MRISFVTRRASPSRGGIEDYVQLLTHLLSAHDEVRVATQRVDQQPVRTLVDALRPPRHFSPFRAGGVETVPIRPSLAERARLARDLPGHAPGLSQPLAARRGARRHAHFARAVGPAIARACADADVLHVVGGGNLASATATAGRRLHRPVVMSPHAHPGQWDDDAASGAAYRAADRVVASSAADAATYRALGVDDERLVICSLPVAAPLSGRGAALRRSIGSAGPLVVFLGVRRAYKGVDITLRAVPTVRRAHPDVVFAFVGPGPPLDGAPEGVLDVGAVDDTGKHAYLEAADVLVLPSAGESFGLVVGEAWSHGVPVVTSDVPALRDLVGAAGGGLAVPRDPHAVAAAIAELLGEPERARAMGERGRAHWRRHMRPEAVAGTMRQVYLEVQAAPTARRTDR